MNKLSFNTLGYLMIVLCFNFSFMACAQKPAAVKAENEGWITSLDEAYNLSKKTGRPIMANFTGSDWCGWCKRLTASVFSKDEFKTWASKKVILLELDFPRFKQLPAELQQQNQALQQHFQVSGFPTVWVFNIDKNKTTKQYEFSQLGRTGYKPSHQEFISDVEQMLARK